MAALKSLLRDRDLFQRRVVTPLCVVGAFAVPLLIGTGAMR